MTFQTAIRIFEAIENIEAKSYLLPAIQREFEWSHEKIEWLFDSLMKGYPISSFLFWSVEAPEIISDYRFYEFLRDYRERFNTHNIDANVQGKSNFIAVLDGQQRLTSLYIGLKGTYAYKEKWQHWNDNQASIPTRRLYLDISQTLNVEEEEDGREYRFSFLKDTDTEQRDLYKGKWFRVGKILDLANLSNFNKYVNENSLDETSTDILAKLQEVIFSAPLINFYLEKEQNLQKALNIFIRINSGGQPLDFSDLIMSIAISNWKSKDARKEIHALVDRIQSIGFTISKDLIFKCYLYLYSNDIRFKVTNFTTDNALDFEKNWEKIRDSIEATFKLIRSYGYEDFTLTSKNSVIPIIYYLYHKNIYDKFETSVGHKEDRAIVKKWLHAVTLKRIFGGQSDGTLSQIRKAFTDDVSETKIANNLELFPTKDIDRHIKRDTSVGQEFIEGILTTQKDNRYAFSILALLNPQLDYKNNDFHLDHLHPISGFSDEKIDQLRLSENDKKIFSDKEWNNSIVNLQMLDSNENMSKKDTPLNDWFLSETQTKDKNLFNLRCILPENESLEFSNFINFSKARRKLLAEKLMEILN